MGAYVNTAGSKSTASHQFQPVASTACLAEYTV